MVLFYISPYFARSVVSDASLIVCLLVGYPAVKFLKAARVRVGYVGFCLNVCVCVRVCEGQLAGAVSFPIPLPSRAGFDLSAARSKALSGY